MGTLQELNVRPGIFADATETGAEPYWHDADHVRFRAGKPEKIGGWESLKDLSGNPIEVVGIPCAVHDWTALDGQRFLAIATNSKIYLVNNQQYFNITPIRDSGTINNPFTTTAGSNIVTVTHQNHRCDVSDYVEFSGVYGMAGLNLNGNWEVVDVINTSKYQIAVDANASGAVSNRGGSVNYEYEIHSGRAISVYTTGYGVGLYGTDTYGVSPTDVTVFRRARTWSLDNWGEDLVASPRGSKTYLWDRSLTETARAYELVNVPPQSERVMVSTEDRHLICFGTWFNGEQDLMLIRWSDQEDYNTFTPEVGNTAGSLRLDSGSRIITAVDTRAEKIVFTDESIYSMQYIGSNLVFGVTHLAQSVSILSPNAAANVNGRIYFMTFDNFMIYDGVVDPMPCPVRNYVFNDFNKMQRVKVYASVNRQFNEVVWYYPSSLSDNNDRYVAYNYVENVWYYGTMDRPVMHDVSPMFQVSYGVSSEGTVYLHETGTDADTQPLEAYIETYSFQIGDGQQFMQVSRMIPDFDSLQGSVDMTILSRRYPNTAEHADGPYTLTASTYKVDTRTRARQVAMRVISDDMGDNWRMGTWRAEVQAHGQR